MGSTGKKSQTSKRPSFLNDKGEVRLVENGFDLTPLPLLVDEAPAEESEPEAEAEATAGESADDRTEYTESSYYYSESETDVEDVVKIIPPPVITRLEESPTETLLHIVGRCVAVDDASDTGVKCVERRNAAYEAMCEARKSNPDKFVERHAQTLNAPLKDRASVTAPPSSSTSGCQASVADIYDSTKKARDEEEAELALRRPGTASKAAAVNKNVYRNTLKVVNASKASPDFLLDTSEDKPKTREHTVQVAVREVPLPRDLSAPDKALLRERSSKTMTGEPLAFSCAAMERCVQQNLFHERQMNYRSFSAIVPAKVELASAEAVELEPVQKGAAIETLWQWQAPMAKGRRVTCMAWNKHREDVLVVGYGGIVVDGLPTDGGRVLFWSLRNPGYPERVASLQSGCTSISFSATNPHLLAAGLHDGTVNIYDVRQETLKPTPVFDSRSLNNAHAEPVWTCAWVDKGEDKGEVLVTASTDGRVLEWTMVKGLEASQLMMLKQVGDSEGVISRTASGLCLDVPRDDPTTYLAACEDGTVHKCSDAYAEQYLESYAGHTGPVYKVRSSPYVPSVFVSCSADWTVKLWTQSTSTPIQSFHSADLNDVVTDVCWSPRSATQFASVAGDGRIEVWDLGHSLLDPVVRERGVGVPLPAVDDAPPPLSSPDAGPPEPPLSKAVAATACLFANNAPVLVVGDADGGVTCYKCVNFPAAPPTRDLQVAALEVALAAEE